MNKFLKRSLLILCLTPGTLVARGQSDIKEYPLDTARDTMHITPAMIDSIRAVDEVKPFERKIESVTFIPKGQWITGLSFSYSQSAQNKYQFLVIENLNADTYSVKVTPMLAYAFKDDMAAGLKFSYTRSLAKLANMDLVLGEDTQFNVDHLYSLGHNYYATGIFRNYFSLGNSKRFGFFNEIQLQLGGGQSKITTGRGEDLSGSYETNFSLDIGIVPGIMVFLSNWSALEVNIGVLGFSYHHTKTSKDRIYKSSRHYEAANFRINLFSITFGTTFYL